MKRILISALLLSLAVGAGAQGWTDALTFSDNDYLGTARSVGMGNAMTAVGGDLGSLTFNPAGSAVASYSQFTITPGLSISTVTGQGSLESEGSLIGFQDKIRTPMTRMQIPNFGVMTVMNTGNRTGLKRATFGIVGNITRDYTNKLRAQGTNANTTLAASLASQADGYPESVLSGGFYQNDMPSWESMVGYKGGLFDPIPGREAAYVGLTERVLDNGNLALADKIGQYYGLQRTGYKYDILLNMGLDFNDRFYLGANIGLVSMVYRTDETRSEEALSGGNYPSGFESLRVRSAYRDEGAGMYAKIGFIARPTSGLRIGAAIQTPTVMQVRETYALDARSVAKDIEMSQATPEDEWYYNLTSPFRANAGIAYTIGKVALLSADYEFCDYSRMKLSSYDGYDYDFGYANLDIKDLLGPVHSIRLGGELKAAPELAIRVGYNLTTGAQYNTLTDDDRVVALTVDERLNQVRTAVSFGLGYSSPGSFFADLAVRFQYLPNEYFTPYWYYFCDTNGDLYKDLDIMVPEIAAQSALCNAMLTLGWRF